MQIIGVAGTAKNTGKTTTTASLINSWPEPSTLALTSIGYDGETRDNVTGLPKPRLMVPAGPLVVTAEQCLQAGSAQLTILKRTRETTPLGALVVARVRKPGLVVLAGPNNRRALAWFLEQLAQQGIRLVLVDGALGRLAPMAAAQGLILATGAARYRDLDALAQETAAIEALLSLPQVDVGREPSLDWPLLLVEQQAKDMIASDAVQKAAAIHLSGVVDATQLDSVLQHLARRQQPPQLVFSDPVKLLLAGNPTSVWRLVEHYQQAGGSMFVEQKLPLLAVTVNPFFPDYNQANGRYMPGWVDGVQLQQVVSAALSVLVVDVVAAGGETLARKLGF